MKHTLFTAVLALGSLTAIPAFAQEPVAQTVQAGRPMHNPHKTAMHLQKKLGLSDDQTSKLEPLLAQHRDQAMAIRNNAALSPEQQREQMRGLNRNFHQQVAGVLTPEQMQQWKGLRREHRHNQESTAPTGV